MSLRSVLVIGSLLVAVVQAFRMQTVPKIGSPRAHTKLHVTDKLIRLVDVVASPLKVLEDNSPLLGNFNQFASYFRDEFLYISVLMVSYILVSRSMSEAESQDFDDLEDTLYAIRNEQRPASKTQRMRSRKCPECGGAGEFRINGELIVCDLCDGTGRFEMGGRREDWGLPRSRADRIDNDDF